IWCKLLKQAAERPDSFARPSTGKSNAAKIPIIATTINNSINVNAQTPQIGVKDDVPWKSESAGKPDALQTLRDKARQGKRIRGSVWSASGLPALSPTTLADKTLRFMHSGHWTHLP